VGGACGGGVGVVGGVAGAVLEGEAEGTPAVGEGGLAEQAPSATPRSTAVTAGRNLDTRPAP
jgi:hypothetical protein